MTALQTGTADTHRLGPFTSAAWSNAAVSTYTWWIAGLTLIAALTTFLLGPPTPAVSAIIMVASVGLIGIPHGSYDLAVGYRLLRPRLGRWWVLVFIVGYSLVAAVAALLWVGGPWAGLLVLLLLGAAHWGVDDLEYECGLGERLWLGTSRGVLPVALPLALHAEESARIFEAITGTAHVDPAALASSAWAAILLALPGIAKQLIVSGRSAASPWRPCVEIAVLVCWFAVAPPILAFALYFCMWHSVRHSLRSIGQIEGKRVRSAATEYLAWVAGPTVATWLLAAFAWSALGEMSGSSLTSAAWQIVFVGLFALTVPHLILEVAASRWPRERG